MNNYKGNDSGWILCPSKSFPGKFYYFNVNNGEAAWTLNELQKTTLKKDLNVSKTSCRSKSYPEPNSPPVNRDETHSGINTDPFNKTRTIYNSIDQYGNPSQLYSQVLYPKCLPTPSAYFPNIVWSPVPLAAQMFMPHTIEGIKLMCDRNTQTHELKDTVFVQTSGMSLSERFSIHRNKNFIDPRTTEEFCGNKINDINVCRTIQHSPVLEQTKESFQSSKKTSLNKLTTLEDTPQNGLENLVSTKNLIENGYEKKKQSFNSAQHAATQTLDNNDLRHVLTAKKRNRFVKNTCNGTTNGEGTSAGCSTQTSPRKCVTFDLSLNHKSNSRRFENKPKVIENVVVTASVTKTQPTSQLVNIKILKDLRKMQMASDVWFLTADLHVLVNEFQFINDFVRQDDTCRLLIPYAVMTIIRALTTSKTDNVKLVLAARNIVRRLMDSPRHITLLQSDGEMNVPISRQILHCCVKLLQRNFHVVLITTDTELLSKSQTIGVHCYLLRQIDKEIIQGGYNTDLLKVGHDETNRNGLFLQKPNEFQRIVDDNKPQANNPLKIYENYSHKGLERVIKNEAFTQTSSVNDNCKNTEIIQNHYKLNRDNTSNEINNNVTTNTLKVKVDSFINNKEKCNRFVSLKTLNEKQFKENTDDFNVAVTEFSSTDDCNTFCNKEKRTAVSISESVMSNDYISDSLYVKLKQFNVKNKIMEDRIVTRYDEWICSFTQIMENFMYDMIKDDSSSIFPLTIPECAEAISRMFEENATIQLTSSRLLTLYNLICPNGRLKSNVNAIDLLRTIGCGMLLVQSFKKMLPLTQQLIETENSLIHLLHCIEDPNSDYVPLKSVRTPTISRSEEDVPETKQAYVKSTSEILEYLKKHFPQWKLYEDSFTSANRDVQQKFNESITTVVRTTGLHLNLLQINNSNQLTLCSYKNNENKFNLTLNGTENDGFNDNDSKSDLSNEINNETSENNDKSRSEIINNDANELFSNSSITKYNLSLLKHDKNDCLTQNHDLNDDLRLTSEDMSDSFTDSYHTKIINCDNRTPNRKMMMSDVSNDDSGLGNENCNVHTTIRNFLIELSSTLVAINKFIHESAMKIKCRKTQEDSKIIIKAKAEKTIKFLCEITDQLKRIIEREPDKDGTTVISLLIKSGVDVSNDKRILRYKQVVTKCLEQTYILQQGLKILLCITNDTANSISIFEPDQIDTFYFNIFE